MEVDRELTEIPQHLVSSCVFVELLTLVLHKPQCPFLVTQTYGVKLVGADAHGAGISSTTLSRIVVIMGEPSNKL